MQEPDGTHSWDKKRVGMLHVHHKNPDMLYPYTLGDLCLR